MPLVTQLRPDLSYVPAKPRLKQADVRHIRYDFFYTIPSQQAAIEDVAKDYVALFESKGVSEGFSLYQTLVGSDLPVYVGATASKGPADFYTTGEATRQAVAQEAQALQARALSVVRRLESVEGYVRRDLSYP